MGIPLFGIILNFEWLDIRSLPNLFTLSFVMVINLGYDNKASPINLTRVKYYANLDRTVNDRDRYLVGALPEKEAIRIIHVPAIQEPLKIQRQTVHPLVLKCREYRDY